MTNSNNNENIKKIQQTSIKKVSLFATKSSTNGKWNYNSKVYLKGGQTTIVKECFGNSLDELIKVTQELMLSL